MTEAKPLRLISKIFVGLKEKNNFFSCWTWSREEEILELPRCEEHMFETGVQAEKNRA